MIDMIPVNRAAPFIPPGVLEEVKPEKCAGLENTDIYSFDSCFFSLLLRFGA